MRLTQLARRNSYHLMSVVPPDRPASKKGLQVDLIASFGGKY
jgi:hypothetical protein